MNKKIKYISGLLLSAIIMFTACEENEYAYDTFDPAKDKTAQTVLLSQPNITVSVNPTLETTTIVIGVQLWGSLSKEDIVIPFVVDSATMDASWYTIAGGGFIIPAGKNSGTLSMTITNDVFPGGYYALYYKLGEVACVSVSEYAKVGVIDAFSPGDLWPFMGTLNAYAVSYFSPGAWDEEWSCTVVLDREDPNSINIYGLGGKNTGKYLKATIDLDAGTIIAANNQNIGNCYGYGDIIAVGFPVMQGTVDAATGEMIINDMRFNMTGAYAGYVWDIFDATFTPAGKNTNYVEIPSGKKPVKM